MYAASRRRSQALAAASIASGDVVINLLDTPGNPDFVGEVRAGLRAADAVLFVVSASDEIDDATRMLWRECESTNMPRAIAVTKLEQSRADYEEAVARCRRVFGDVQPLGVPLIEDGHVVGAINLLRRSVTDYRSGEPVRREPDETEAGMIEEYWDPLIESIIEESEDETLLDRHLSGEQIDLDIVMPDLRAAVGYGAVLPDHSGARTDGDGHRRAVTSCSSRDSRRRHPRHCQRSTSQAESPSAR